MQVDRQGSQGGREDYLGPVYPCLPTPPVYTTRTRTVTHVQGAVWQPGPGTVLPEELEVTLPGPGFFPQENRGNSARARSLPSGEQR